MRTYLKLTTEMTYLVMEGGRLGESRENLAVHAVYVRVYVYTTTYIRIYVHTLRLMYVLTFS